MVSRRGLLHHAERGGTLTRVPAVPLAKPCRSRLVEKLGWRSQAHLVRYSVDSGLFGSRSLPRGPEAAGRRGFPGGPAYSPADDRAGES
jgi:hypothetical protein